MTISVGFVCGRRGSGGRVIVANCDAAGCRAGVVCSSRDEYLAAAAAGWRRRGSLAYCPAHSSAAGEPGGAGG